MKKKNIKFIGIVAVIICIIYGFLFVNQYLDSLMLKKVNTSQQQIKQLISELDSADINHYSSFNPLTEPYKKAAETSCLILYFNDNKYI